MANENVNLSPEEKAEMLIQNFKENYLNFFLSKTFEEALKQSVACHFRKFKEEREIIEVECGTIHDSIISKIETLNFQEFFFEICLLNMNFQKKKSKLEKNLKNDVRSDFEKVFGNTEVAKILVYLTVWASVEDGKFIPKKFHQFMLEFQKNSEKVYEIIKNQMIKFYVSNGERINLRYVNFRYMLTRLKKLFPLFNYTTKIEIYNKSQIRIVVQSLYKYEMVNFFERREKVENSDLIRKYLEGMELVDIAKIKGCTIEEANMKLKGAVTKIYNKIKS